MYGLRSPPITEFRLLPSWLTKLHIPAATFSGDKMTRAGQSARSPRDFLPHPAEYVKDIDYPLAWLNADAFAAVKMKEEDAERAVGEAMKQAGMRDYYTRSQLARGEVPEHGDWD